MCLSSQQQGNRGNLPREILSGEMGYEWFVGLTIDKEKYSFRWNTVRECEVVVKSHNCGILSGE